MYNQPAFREPDRTRKQQFIRDHPLGLLISSQADMPQASPLPFLLDAIGPVGLGVLRGHLSKGNEHWRVLDGTEVLVVFQGPDAYVSPSWYVSKREHGKVVPTWNYVTVQARGVARVIDDANWLRQQIAQLTEAHESTRPAPWRVGDAPADFIDAQVFGIIGVEIEIRELDGKWKVSQNRSVEDRMGVVKGLTESGEVAMASLVQERIPDPS